MKEEIENYLTKCLECQQVKVIHQHPTSLIQAIPILEWKWEVITMDFIIRLPKTQKQHDSNMVVVDKLSKVAHFISKESTYKEIIIIDKFHEGDIQVAWPSKNNHF